MPATSRQDFSSCRSTHVQTHVQLKLPYNSLQRSPLNNGQLILPQDGRCTMWDNSTWRVSKKSKWKTSSVPFFCWKNSLFANHKLCLLSDCRITSGYVWLLHVVIFYGWYFDAVGWTSASCSVLPREKEGLWLEIEYNRRRTISCI